MAAFVSSASRTCWPRSHEPPSATVGSGILFDQVLVGGDDAKAKFGGTPLPTTYLIDRDGRIRQKIIGARDRAGWEAAVKPLLDEPAATAQNGN